MTYHIHETPRTQSAPGETHICTHLHGRCIGKVVRCYSNPKSYFAFDEDDSLIGCKRGKQAAIAAVKKTYEKNA